VAIAQGSYHLNYFGNTYADTPTGRKNTCYSIIGVLKRSTSMSHKEALHTCAKDEAKSK